MNLWSICKDIQLVSFTDTELKCKTHTVLRTAVLPYCRTAVLAVLPCRCTAACSVNVNTILFSLIHVPTKNKNCRRRINIFFIHTRFLFCRSVNSPIFQENRKKHTPAARPPGRPTTQPSDHPTDTFLSATRPFIAT